MLSNVFLKMHCKANQISLNAIAGITAYIWSNLYSHLLQSGLLITDHRESGLLITQSAAYRVQNLITVLFTQF
jgi:hypothetical protein